MFSIFGLIVLFVFVFSISLTDNDDEAKQKSIKITEQSLVKSDQIKLPVPDYDMKGNIKEIHSGKTMRYQISVVPNEPLSITEEDIKLIVEDVVSTYKQKMKFHVFIVFVHDDEREDYANMASVVYAPFGELSDYSHLKVGDYSNHEYNYSFNGYMKDTPRNLDNYPTEDEMSLYFEYMDFSQSIQLSSLTYVDSETIEEAFAAEYGLSVDELDSILKKVIFR